MKGWCRHAFSVCQHWPGKQRGQGGTQTPLCWPLSPIPHRLSLDMGARTLAGRWRVSRGRGLLQQGRVSLGLVSGLVSPAPLPSWGGLQIRPPGAGGLACLVVSQAAGVEAPQVSWGCSLLRLKEMFQRPLPSLPRPASTENCVCTVAMVQSLRHYPPMLAHPPAVRGCRAEPSGAGGTHPTGAPLCSPSIAWLSLGAVGLGLGGDSPPTA